MNDPAIITTLLDELIELDPSYADDIRPASAEQLATLERLAGPLPPRYTEFLRRMGSSWGIERPRTELGIERLCAYYQQFDWRPPPGLTLIGLDNFGNSEDYFLDTRGGGDPVVCGSAGDELADDELELEAPSLAAFLFYSFFTLRYLPRQAFVVEATKVTELDGAQTKAVEIATRLGLRVHPRSEAGHVYLVGEGVVAAISQPPGYGLGVTIGATKPGEAERLYALLDDYIGLVRL